MTEDQQREAIAVEMSGLRRDAERLTWIINESEEGRGWLGEDAWDMVPTYCDGPPQEAIREAIDAAMKEAPHA